MGQVGAEISVLAADIPFLLGSSGGLHCFQPRGCPASLSRRLSAIKSLIVYLNASSLTVCHAAPALLHNGSAQTAVCA